MWPFHSRQANGTGKTGIARILAGLWPVAEGLVKRPEEIFFLPQRPYLPLGSLRDQIIYPFTWPDLQAAGKTDSDLLDLLEHVHLAYLPGREGGLDTRKEWKDVLSGGEKQRISIARLFFAKSLPLSAPDFAVLDEATSAVSSDVEGAACSCLALAVSNREAQKLTTRMRCFRAHLRVCQIIGSHAHHH